MLVNFDGGSVHEGSDYALLAYKTPDNIMEISLFKFEYHS